MSPFLWHGYALYITVYVSNIPHHVPSIVILHVIFKRMLYEF